MSSQVNNLWRNVLSMMAKPLPTAITFCVIVLLCTGGGGRTAWGQTPGGASPLNGLNGLLAAPATLRDYRQQLRDFVQSIGLYARAQKPGFMIVAQNGIELLGKADPENDANFFPARTYMRTLDALMSERLFTVPQAATTPGGVPQGGGTAQGGHTTQGVTTTSEIPQRTLDHLTMARKYGLTVLSLEYASKSSQARQIIRKNMKKRFIPYVGFSAALSKLSPWRPENNPKSILSMRDVKNFAYLRDTQGFGTADEFANALHNTNYDLVIVDVFHGRAPLSKQQIELMKYKKLGAKRLVFAHINITAAQSYRYYWKAKWKEGAPAFIKAPFATNPDKYHVNYANPAWQSIISGNAKSYIYGIIAQGFDGVVLDGLDAYRYFEGGL